MNNKLSVKLDGDKQVQELAQGFHVFTNLAKSGQQKNTGMVVQRGNSAMLEALE
ncbi:small nuclear ribonucleoprotein G-like [Ochotona princeps]|uniref:small nuclear ribonucleoprotein G-like n=1 Tax=Ochotona princeps TaxID=9978 RepID=UPI001788CCE0|nr:small nuclear ribonucleoprotein G-like [Ochotona princeps]